MIDKSGIRYALFSEKTAYMYIYIYMYRYIYIFIQDGAGAPQF